MTNSENHVAIRVVTYGLLNYPVLLSSLAEYAESPVRSLCSFMGLSEATNRVKRSGTKGSGG